MPRPFARLKGVNKAADQYAIENNRRPFVFGFVTEKGTAIYRDGSVPMGADDELLKIWDRLCTLNACNSMSDLEHFDKEKAKRGAKGS